MSNRVIGTVIRVKDAGYGFLMCPAGNVFFHADDLPPEIPFEDSFGRRFDFALESNDGKLRARDMYEHVGETFSGVIGPIREGRDFAFIQPDAGGTATFVHRFEVQGDFVEGKRVSYQVQETPRGTKAVCVKVLE